MIAAGGGGGGVDGGLGGLNTGGIRRGILNAHNETIRIPP